MIGEKNLKYDMNIFKELRVLVVVFYNQVNSFLLQPNYEST